MPAPTRRSLITGTAALRVRVADEGQTAGPMFGARLLAVKGNAK